MTTARRATHRWASGSPRLIHHGSDHRSQVCTALTSLGLTPPPIDVWDLAESQGRLVEVPPPAG